jgi:hypothetical protein
MLEPQTMDRNVMQRPATTNNVGRIAQIIGAVVGRELQRRAAGDPVGAGDQQ